MVFEQLFKVKWIERRHIYSFFLGILFTAFGYLTTLIVFRKILGLGTIFFTVILAIPSINILFSREEKRGAEGKKSFFREHEAIFDIFLYFFLGCFLTFLFIGSFGLDNIYGGKIENTNIVVVDRAAEEAKSYPTIPKPDFELDSSEKTTGIGFYISGISSIFLNNLYVMVISFALCLFYGAGAVFLIIYNASVFAYGILSLIQRRAAGIASDSAILYSACNLGIFLLHLIPEVSAYLISAIAGGILSKAFIREKFGSEKFWRVIGDAVKLLTVAFLILLLAAGIEFTISNRMLVGDSCRSDALYLIISWVLFLVLLIASLEMLRFRHKRGKH
jgi:hypothetical protein